MSKVVVVGGERCVVYFEREKWERIRIDCGDLVIRTCRWGNAADSLTLSSVLR